MKASYSLLVLCLSALAAEGVCDEPGYPSVLGKTHTYVFITDESIVVQTGGLAGVDETYAVRGSFQVTVDLDTGTATFDSVDASLVGDSPFLPTHSLNDLFNMTKLSGIVLSDTLIEFVGKTSTGTGEMVQMGLSIVGDRASLTGRTIPPPDSADLFVFALEAVARRQQPGQPCSPPGCAESGEYIFLRDRSMVTQTGGIGGIEGAYSIQGRFQSVIDFDASTASFSAVDAKLVDSSGVLPERDLGDVFNLAGLVGTIMDESTILFEGQTADGSDVFVTLSCEDGYALLVGETVPPPNSADLFVITMEAIARRQYTGGTGRPDDPYLICTAKHMNAIGADPNDWDKHFKLMADIDLSGYTGDSFQLIGPDPSHPFTGVFDGNGHVISGFTYVVERGDNVGLFGVVDDPNALIKDLKLADAKMEVQWGWRAGSLVGHLRQGALTNCHVADAAVQGVLFVGGLVGENGYTEPESGKIRTVGTIEDCSYAGTVSGGLAVGGLVGRSAGGSLRRCYADTDLAGDWQVGGLAGYLSSGTISACYSMGCLTGENRAGGLVGDCDLGAIADCYSTGIVIGEKHVGGLIGSNYAATVTASFWDIPVSGQADSAGGIGKTTLEMQASYTFLDAGWDFVGETANGTEDIWSIEEGLDYPRLAWEREDR